MSKIGETILPEWTKPRLIVLAKGNPEEDVLMGNCRSDSKQQAQARHNACYSSIHCGGCNRYSAS